MLLDAHFNVLGNTSVSWVLNCVNVMIHFKKCYNLYWKYFEMFCITISLFFENNEQNKNN